MALIRTILTMQAHGELSRDAMVNTVYHNIGTVLPDGSDINYNNHAMEVGKLWAGQDPTYPGVATGPTLCQVTARVYNMADPHTKGHPRPERGFWQSADPGSPVQSLLRQQALCLSFYATRNLARQRGRVYIGPWFSPTNATEYAPSGAMSQVLANGHGLFDIGGENVAHVVYSHVTQPDGPNGVSGDSPWIVTDYWADNSWDIVRRRKQKATQKQTLHP